MTEIDPRVEAALLPCPFCGGSNLNIHPIGRDGHYILCLDCNSNTGVCRSDAEARAAWNRRTPAALRAADVAGWSTEPPPHTHINVRSTTSYRWLPYKGGSQQFQRGIKGRWQRATEYGWENAELAPGAEWQLNPHLPTAPGDR